MFNILVSSNSEAWKGKSYSYSRNRFLEHTVEEIRQRFIELRNDSINNIKTYPTLFMTEQENQPTKIGHVTDVRIKKNEITLEYEIFNDIKEIPKPQISNLKEELDIDEWELYRTHWAIKDVNLFEVLLKENLITEKNINLFSEKVKSAYPLPNPNEIKDKSSIFIVHGHDDLAKNEISNFIKELRLQPIVLNQEANTGKTIIEKFEEYSKVVNFAIILYTECDIGFKKTKLPGKYRARQNVIFEHGYFTGKLGRERVCIIIKGDIEKPSDVQEIVHISMNQDSNDWKDHIKKELKAAGFDFK